MSAVVRAGCAWIAGRLVADAADLAPRADDHAVRAELALPANFGGDRIARADRPTQLAALVVARALAGLDPVGDPDALAVLSASALATAHTNERFERRRIEGRAPEPRVFPYTAPNAAGAEIALALRARGPTLALVGGVEVGMLALERACAMLARGACTRAVVVALECPPETVRVVAPAGPLPVECAAALVLERGAAVAAPVISLRFAPAEDTADEAHPLAALGSVGPLAALAVALRRRASVELSARGDAGARVVAALVT